MGKPSIFSREYEKKMKRRKVKIILLIVLIVLFIAGVVGRTYLKPFIKEGYDSIVNNFKAKEEPKEDENTAQDEKQQDEKEKEESTPKKEQEMAKEGSYDIALANNVNVKATYEEKNGEKTFQVLDTQGNKVFFDLSPSAKNMILIDESSQNIANLAIDGKVKDITLITYASSSGQAFEKNSVLQSNPAYVWHKTPKFIDETHVAYISQLPWFNRNDKYYIWIVDVNSGEHKFINNVEGSAITFGSVVEKGLEVNVDGNKVVLNGNGEVIQ